ncbi:hypothetical protein BHM03_00051907 [Ensete ventricosum]|nr:hypothetical protein BHM03_00051907 [Ensete ventricosum]
MLLIFLIVGSQVLSSQLNPLTEQQMRAVTGLQQCSQQAEDALSQGLEKLQQTLSETLACDLLGTFSVTNYMGQMAIAMTKLEALASFVNQVIHKLPICGPAATERFYEKSTVSDRFRPLTAE